MVKNKLEVTLKKISNVPIMFSHQMSNDPDSDLIANSGKMWKETQRSKPTIMEEGACHWNVSKLFKEGKIDTIGVGYAKNFQGWHQHTFGLKDNKVVETTDDNLRNTIYYGIPLSKEQSKSFSKFVLQKENKKGNGNVRTIKGGYKIA
jgi:hypothetical protein